MNCCKCFAFFRPKVKETHATSPKVAPKQEKSSTIQTSEDVIGSLRHQIARSFESQNFAPIRPYVDEVVIEKVLIPVYLQTDGKFVNTGESVEMAFTEH